MSEQSHSRFGRSAKSSNVWRLAATGVVAAAAVASLAGCGSSGGSAAMESTTPPPPLEELSPSSAPAPSSTPAASAAIVPVTSAPVPSAPDASKSPAATPAPVAVAAVMPSVVCMNLQAAQDAIQDAGVFFSRSADATGAGRRQVVDSNWIVVGQTPPAGATVGEAEAVLSAVKIGEPSPC